MQRPSRQTQRISIEKAMRVEQDGRTFARRQSGRGRQARAIDIDQIGIVAPDQRADFAGQAGSFHSETRHIRGSLMARSVRPARDAVRGGAQSDGLPGQLAVAGRRHMRAPTGAGQRGQQIQQASLGAA
jgi:hypothetical protein